MNALKPNIRKILREQGLTYLGPVKRPARYELYEFSQDGGDPSCVLKKLPLSSRELDFYAKRLPRVSGNFNVLQVPELLEIFMFPDEAYVLLPYYDGHHFDFHNPDKEMAKQMVAVVKDLLKIDVEKVVERGSKFDYERYESEFRQSFDEAVSLGLILVDHMSAKKIAKEILHRGRDTQRMIVSNGDFNPRNLIRLNSKLVLIDWSEIVAPLEHHLTYSWLLNFENEECPEWQKTYATCFENEISVDMRNIRYHLMHKALRRAVAEMKFYKQGKGDACRKRASNYMTSFNFAIEGF